MLGILWLFGVGSILALVFGYMGKNQIDGSGGAQQGRGMAIAGIVLGLVGLGLIALWIVGALVNLATYNDGMAATLLIPGVS